MVDPLTLKESRSFLSQHVDSYIPGYTGYCPGLKFQYGTSYGSRTKKILKEVSEQKVIYDEIHKTNNYVLPLIKPPKDLKVIKHPEEDLLDHPLAFQKHIAGYTGCIPLMNCRYGESYGKVSEECFSEFKTEQAHSELDGAAFSDIHPKLVPIWSNGEVIQQYAGHIKFEDKEIPLDRHPMYGYTGHVPMVDVEEHDDTFSNRYFLRD